MTTILDCHLRWKGEEDRNGVPAYYAVSSEGGRELHDRWRYGGIISPRLLGYAMAKRKYSGKRTRNMDPAVMTLTFTDIVVPPTGFVTQYIDLSQVASLVNRRFYRQGINWAVAGFKVLSESGATGAVIVNKLQNTWITSSAWEKAFRKWNKQQMDAIADMSAESAVARFRDFKIHMDGNHVSAGFGNNLLPVDALNNTVLAGEWEASQVVIPNDGAPGVTNEYFVQMNGASTPAAKSIVGGYKFSRSYPQSPDPVSPNVETSWLNRMFDVGDDNDDVLDNATDRNDELPYDQVAYPGDPTNMPGLQTHDISFVSSTTIGGTTRLKGGNFPCGLIQLNVQNTSEQQKSFTMQIDLVPGHHRGYLCEPMTEM